jgi:uncharacterized membrane protein YvbJ
MPELPRQSYVRRIVCVLAGHRYEGDYQCSRCGRSAWKGQP